MCSVSLPVLTPTPAHPLRITPTDISQFVRLEQCERFLRFRLSERAGLPFMEEYGVTHQRITPLLSLSGKTFEEGVEGEVGGRFRSFHYAEKYGEAHNRPTNNPDVLAEVARLKPGEVIILFQTRLEATLDAWFVRGDVDLIRLERLANGRLHALIADMKSTTEAKVEHRLQVAFYHLMLDRILADAAITGSAIQTGILFRPPSDPTTEEAVEVIPPLREAAEKWFGLKDVLLEVVADPDAYLRSVSDLVTGPKSTALRVGQAAFADVPFCLSFKCDGCLYNEFCMKDAAEREDLSLLPYMNGVEKEALRRAGVTTIQSLATLKDFATLARGTPVRKADLVPAPGLEAVVRRVAATWPVGPRLDELVHRAKSFRRSVKKDGTEALGYIPDKGNSTLPASRPDLNPNLVRVYLDAQHDYLNDRLYLLGALVVACKDGVPDPARRRTIVRMTDGPPETAAQEQQLFVDWTRELVKAVMDLAAPGEKKDGKNTAPIHIVFYDRYEQRLLLEGLARNFPPILKNTPPLYDFLTQFAGFDSPVASFLSEEIREFKNYPMTCQSLQSVATYLKFDWNSPLKFRDAFKARVFDYLGKLDSDGTSEWYTRRSRFASSVPLEYAYAAWDHLPMPKPGRGDEFADFRGVTRNTILAFQGRRLEALEHVANAFPGNPNAQKTPFVLPDLAGFEDKAATLAHALAEFVAIERHVAMSEWRGTRHTPPERRVLMGETLLVRYVEADQEPGVAEQNRENQRRQRKRAEAEAAHNAKNTGKPFRVPRGQGEEYKWSPEGMAVTLRVETVGVDCDLHEALAMTTFREGDRLVLFPRWAVDERLPAAERQEFTPTPKQLLYGNRAELKRIVATEKDASGRVRTAVVEAELKESFGGGWSRGYVFPSISRPLEDGRLYTLDPCPNDWYGYWCSQVVQGLCRGEPNRLYDLLNNPVAWGRDASGSLGQMKFLAGLLAFRDEGLLHDFEKSKRSFIGGYGKAPVLLVQGPPGTGKSYCTAFAIFGRIQGAMQQGRPCRVFVSCKTHAATDVLVKNVLDVQKKLRELRRPPPQPYHILAQQLMALCLQERGVGRREWTGWLEAVPAFTAMPAEQVSEVVVWMLAQGILVEEEGLLWFGRKGEAEFGWKNFLELFSVFLSPPLFAVRHGRQELGFVDETSFLSRREGPQILLLGGRAWRVTHLDWGRRLAHVEAAEEVGRSRWRGAGPTLGFALCQAIRRLLAGQENSPRWSRRTQGRFTELREEHAWVHANGTSLLSRSSGVEWWTFAGTRANGNLAWELFRRCGGRVDHDAFAITVQGTEDFPAVEQAVRQLMAVEPSFMEPPVEEAALDGLKFSQCVPKELALATLAARLRDEPALRAVLTQPMRVISGA